MKANATSTVISNWRGLRNWTMAAALAVPLALLTTPPMRAGTISVVNLPATGTDAASGISSANTYLDAWDFGNNGTTPTINGVPFTHYSPPAGTSATNYAFLTDPNFGGTLTLQTPGANGPVAGTTYNLGRTSSATQGNLAAQADGNMNTLLTDLIYETGPVDNTMQDWFLMDFGGLTAGDQYSLRIYYRYWGNSSGRLQDFYFDGEGTEQAYSSNPLDEDAGGAHYIEYDFTAASTIASVSITNAATIGNESMMVYGATVQEIPEPTVAGVLAVGGLLLGLRYWRRAPRRTSNT